MNDNLFREMYESFHFIIGAPTPDGEGGFRMQYTEGAEFEAHARFDTTIEARTGAAAGVSSRYTINAPTSVPLEYHMIVRRDRDGKFLRVKSDGDDVITPNQATFSFHEVEAEEWEIPAGLTV